MNKSYYNKDQVAAILGVGSTKAWEVIKCLNNELESKGFIIVRGKISRKYFQEKYYCDPEDIEETLKEVTQ